MTLIEECRLWLDDPVDGLLPELADRKVLTRIDAPLDDTVPAQRPITVRDLLTFLMGTGLVVAQPGEFPIQPALDEAGLSPGPAVTQVEPDEWMKRLGSLPLVHQPGEKWMYHTGSDTLGVLMARATGRPLPELLAERIFGPLGMPDTGFHVPAAPAAPAGRRLPARRADRSARAHRRPAAEPMGASARLPVGGRGVGLHRRRPAGVLHDDAEQGPVRRRAHPVPAVGGADDHRSAHQPAEGRKRRILRGQQRLGAWGARLPPAHRPGLGPRPFRLERRRRDLGVYRPGRGADRGPADPAGNDLAGATARVR